MGALIYKDLEAFLSTGELNVWAYVSDNPFVGFVVCDNTGRILHTNEPHAYIVGKPTDELIGRNIGEFVEEGYIYRALTIEVIKCGHALMEEQNRQGRNYMVKTDPIFNEDGEIVYVVSLLLDVSLERTLKVRLEKTQQDNAIMQRRLDELQRQLDAAHDAGDPESGQKLLYVSKQMRDVHAQIEYIAGASSAVLITGESGVGKELAARTIQRTSTRKDKPFITINCAAIPAELLESELFGYVGGAFTNSRPGGKAGLFESVEGGTILLDEIGEMPRRLQAKLLRVLQEKEVRRVGGTENISVDVRIIAATNQNLEELIERGRFRNDLYYRLNVIPIHIPALRERREDVPILAYSFLDFFNKKYGKSKSITNEGYNCLLELPYQGNVRQLENTIERIVLLCQEDTVLPDDILHYYSMTDKSRAEPAGTGTAADISLVPSHPKGGGRANWKQQRKDEETRLILDLARQGMSTHQIARRLGIGQSTIWRRLKEADMDKKA